MDGNTTLPPSYKRQRPTSFVQNHVALGTFVLVVLFQFIITIPRVDGSKCSLHASPLELAIYNSTTESYEIDRGNDGDDSQNRRRRNVLRTRTKQRKYTSTTINGSRWHLDYLFMDEEGVDASSSVPAFPVSQNTRTLHEGNKGVSDSSMMQVRVCPCVEGEKGESYYCPADRDYCEQSRFQNNTMREPTCANSSQRIDVVRTIWPVTIVWIAFMSVCLVCTTPGRNAIDHVISRIFPRWNDHVINVMMMRNPNRVNLLIRRHYWRRRESFERHYEDIMIRQGRDRRRSERESTNERLPTELRLRTKIFESSPPKDDSAGKTIEYIGPDSSSSSQNENDAIKNDSGQEPCGQTDLADNEQTCSICFIALEDGERVGALPCNHIFHVDCLKGWLTRRNVCPLCMHADIARPYYSVTE